MKKPKKPKNKPKLGWGVWFGNLASEPVKVDAVTKVQAENLACNEAKLRRRNILKICRITQYSLLEVTVPPSNPKPLVVDTFVDDSPDDQPFIIKPIRDPAFDYLGSSEESQPKSWVDRILDHLPPSLHWWKRKSRVP